MRNLLCIPVFNILSRKKLKLREKPPIVLDCTVQYDSEVSPELLLEQVLGLLATVRKYRGNFVLLWHNFSFNTHFWKPYEGIYSKIIDTLHRGPADRFGCLYPKKRSGQSRRDID